MEKHNASSTVSAVKEALLDCPGSVSKHRCRTFYQNGCAVNSQCRSCGVARLFFGVFPITHVRLIAGGPFVTTRRGPLLPS